MRHFPSTRALVAFQAAAQCLSFTQAAKKLNVTQGAVSHQVQGLEKLLGVSLFLRQKQRLKLTEQGVEYLTFVSDALATLQQGAESLQKKKQSGVLTVSVSPNFASKWLVHRLGDFVRQHPDIELRISASMQHVDLEFSDVDVAIRHGNNDWPDLEVTRLCQERNIVVCSPHYYQQNAHLLSSPKSLTTMPLLQDNSRQDWQSWFAIAGVDLNKVDNANYRGAQFDQTSMVLDAAIEGQGIALTRSALATRDLLAGRLVSLFDITMPAAYSYYIVHSKADANVQKILRFKQWLLAEAREEENKYQQFLLK